MSDITSRRLKPSFFATTVLPPLFAGLIVALAWSWGAPWWLCFLFLPVIESLLHIERHLRRIADGTE